MNNDTLRENNSFNHPGELAHILESMPLAERAEFWQSLHAEARSNAIPHLHDEIKESLLGLSTVEQIQSMAETLESADVADVIELLPEDIAQEIIDSLSEKAKEEVEESLSFDDETVGRLLRRDSVRLSPGRTVGQALSHIKHNGLPKYSDKLFMISASGQYMSAVALTSLLEAESVMRLSELPEFENESIFSANTHISDVISDFRKSHFISAAVVDEDGVFLGRITAEDAITALQDDADHQLLSMAGLDEDDDLFAPIKKSAQRRAIWLGINLLTAFLASYVIGLFEATVQEMVALAVLMPVVASMGGIAGSQTLTIVIRGLALGQLTSANTKNLLFKELSVGFLNGVLWSIVVGLVAFYWFDNQLLSLIIGAAILINLLVAAFTGLVVPVILDKAKIDPALSGSVVLTTVTDVVGFISFLGLATLFLI